MKPNRRPKPKPQAKHKCEGCVWQAQAGPGVVFCMLPKCRRRDFRGLWMPKKGNAGHGKTKDD